MQTRPDSRRRRHLTAVLALASLIVALVVVQTASAAPSPRPFRADVDGAPDPVAAGSTATIRLTLFNDSTELTIGSSDVVAPAGYVLPEQTIALEPPATATVSGGVIELRNLSIKPVTSLSVEFTAIAPCEGDGPWSVDARRSSDHSSGSGDFQLDVDGSDLVVGPAGRCHLAFATEPANTELGSSSATQSEPVTGVPYDPDGAPVAVEVLDGAGARIATSNAPVTLTLGGGTAGAVLALNGSTDVTVPAVQGLATFSALTIDRVGFGYTTTASAVGIDPAVSGPFNVMQFGQVCSGETCDSPTATNGSNTGTGTVHAMDVPPDVELAIAFAGDDPCTGTGYLPVLPDTFTVLALEGGEPSAGVVLEITLVVFKAQAAGRKLPNFQVCFATDVEGKTFLDKTGAEVSQGLLPKCSAASSLDCIVSKTKDRLGNVTVVFRVLDGRGKT